MTRKHKRTLSLVLALLTLVSMFSFAAAAASTTSYTYYGLLKRHNSVVGNIEITVDGPYSAASGFVFFEGVSVNLTAPRGLEFEVDESSDRIIVDIYSESALEFRFTITLSSRGMPTMDKYDYSDYDISFTGQLN